MEREKNTNRPFLSPTYGLGKADKKLELNPSMSISPTSKDRFTTATMNPNGGGN